MTDTTTHASAAPTTPDSTPVEWHTVDADDRWPGRWTAHTASVHAHGRTYLIRITPGDHATYLAPGSTPTSTAGTASTGPSTPAR